MSWRDLGKDPDYRYSLANERTFLAWIRTALAILAGAVILREFAGSPGAPGGFVVLSIVLALLAGFLGGAAYFRWRNNELAMRLEQALQISTFAIWLGGIMGLLGVGTAVWLFLEQL